MWAYSLRRLIQAAVLLLLASVAVFLLLRLIPGDPAYTIAGPNAREEQLEAVREELGQFWVQSRGGQFHARLDLAVNGHEPNGVGGNRIDDLQLAVASAIPAVAVEAVKELPGATEALLAKSRERATLVPGRDLERPRLPRGPGGGRELRRLHLEVRRREADREFIPEFARLPGDQSRIGRAEQGPSPPRVQIPRLDGVLRPHAGDRTGQ